MHVLSKRCALKMTQSMYGSIDIARLINTSINEYLQRSKTSFTSTEGIIWYLRRYSALPDWDILPAQSGNTFVTSVARLGGKYSPIWQHCRYYRMSATVQTFLTGTNVLLNRINGQTQATGVCWFVFLFVRLWRICGLQVILKKSEPLIFNNKSLSHK